MSVSSIPSASAIHSHQALQQAPVRAGRQDHDNDATESSAAKAQEAAKSGNANLGNSVNGYY